MTDEDLMELLENIEVDLKCAVNMLEKYQGPNGGYSDLRQLKALLEYINNEAKAL